MPQLADRFRLIAPDYPGFGFSDAPAPQQFAYTFDHLAEIVGKFVDALGITKASLYVQEYGGPVGFRLATARPVRRFAVATNLPLATSMPISQAEIADRKALFCWATSPTSSTMRGFSSIPAEYQTATCVSRRISARRPTFCRSGRRYHRRPLPARSRRRTWILMRAERAALRVSRVSLS